MPILLGAPEWLEPQPIIDLFGSLPVYADFLNDRRGYRASLDDIKDERAD